MSVILPSPTPPQTRIARYFSRIRVVALVSVIFSGAGLTSYFTLTKELNPNIQIPLVFVTTVLPGTSAEDIEQLVTIPLEDAVGNLSGITQATSTSQEGLSRMTLEFVSGTDPDKAKSDVQAAIDTVTSLPKDAEQPSLQVLDFQNQPSVIFALTSRDGDRASLEHFADTLEESAKSLPGVERVVLSYRNDPVIRVSVSPETLASNNLSLTSLSNQISSVADNHPAGSLSDSRIKYALGLQKLAESVGDLRDLPISIAPDTIVPLALIARVEEQPPIGSTEALFADHDTLPTPAILFSVFKSKTADTGVTVEHVRTAANALAEQSEGRIAINATFDGGKEISKSFDQLLHDFFLTLLLVFIVLFLFFGLRQSFVAALAIPLTFLGTFLVMQLSGISINFISLFSLLIALGILVDNAIVIVSAVTSRQRVFTTEDPMQTALHVFEDYKTVIFTTTITTVWAFLPLLLATGLIGEFIKPIPIVVSTALALSAVIALFILLPLMAAFMAGHVPKRVRVFGKTLVAILALAVLFFLLRGQALWFPILLLCSLLLFVLTMALPVVRDRLLAKPRINAWGKRLAHLRAQANLDRVAKRYHDFIHAILISSTLRRRTFIMLVLFSLFSYSLVPLGYVVNEFFPEDDQSILYVRLTLPVGTSLETSKLRAEELTETLRHETQALFVLAEIGAKPPTDNNPSNPESHELLFTLILPDKEDREESSGDIVARLNQELIPSPFGDISATQISGGPPAGNDITLKLLGPDLASLDTYAQTITDHLKEQDGISNISTSLSVNGKLIFVPNTQAIARFGIASDELALALRTLGNGLTAKNDARFHDQKMDIEIALSDDARGASVSDPNRVILTGTNGSAPLGALGHFTLQENPTSINREDGKRVLSISADVAAGFSTSIMNRDLETYVSDTLNLPAEYSFQTAGVNEENDKSVRSILLAMLLSAALIFATMVMQFNSFRKAVIVLLVIPLAVSGVFIIFSLFGIPLSFPALIGILALFGIVVNNSIIMVDKINKNMEQMDDLDEAITSGAASRLEPILLTALTSIIGLIPITLSDPIWQGLGGAIIAGLTFSGVAKLFFIPVIYKSWFQRKARTSASTQPGLTA